MCETDEIHGPPVLTVTFARVFTVAVCAASVLTLRNVLKDTNRFSKCTAKRVPASRAAVHQLYDDHYVVVAQKPGGRARVQRLRFVL